MALLTDEEFLMKLKRQNGRCAICGRHQRGFSKRLAIDHNHATGEIRGLLCHSCNTGIGMFDEDLDILTAAMSYIAEYNGDSGVRSKPHGNPRT